jgi:hypothetical protein
MSPPVTLARAVPALVGAGAMPDKICQAPCSPTCDREHYAYVPLLDGKKVPEAEGGKRTGLCYTHYSNVRRGGDARRPVVPVKKRPPMERFTVYLLEDHLKAAKALAGEDGELSDVVRAAMEAFLARPEAEQRELLGQHLGWAPKRKARRTR